MTNEAMHSAAPDLITMDVLAERTGLPVAWLKREVKKGALPAIRIGGTLRFNIDAVRQAVAAQASKPLDKATEPKRAAPPKGFGGARAAVAQG